MTVEHYSSAAATLAAVRSGEVSARELLAMCRERVEEVNPRVNALVSLDWERAEQQAGGADDLQASGRPLPPLHGLPFAFKDTHAVSGWRTTYGSPVMSDHVPTQDDLLV